MHHGSITILSPPLLATVPPKCPTSPDSYAQDIVPDTEYVTETPNMASTIFQLPNDLLASLMTSFPCRDAQINALTTLIHPRIAPCRNLVVHGAEATGKSAIVGDLLRTLRDHSPSDLDYAIVKSPECVTARHLFERTVGLVGDALRNRSAPGRCETLAALTAELSKMLNYVEGDVRPRFVLVFDGIDRQRDAPPTLLPALARLSEIVRQKIPSVSPPVFTIHLQPTES